ncbi:MAG: PEP-CTERM sorting domain-containing protein [Rhodoferax sp.]|nr:PEP-CTERM sorting domain-containing protein [Rhodoferax sp.]
MRTLSTGILSTILIFNASVASATGSIDFPWNFDVGRQANLVINSPGTPTTSLTDPVVVNANFGYVLGGANTISGAVSGRAFIADTFAQPSIVSVGVSFSLTNISTVAAVIPALNLDVNANFGRTIGTDPGGTVGNTLVATLSAATSNTTALSQFIYTYTDTVDDDPPEVSFSPETQGGFTWTGTYSANDLAVGLAGSSILVQPGDSLAILVSLTGSATAFSFLGVPGYSSFTDFGNTAQLSMTMAPGFAVTSFAPLDWITLTPVPEPSAAALLFLGLLALLIMRYRRSHSVYDA